MIGLHIWSSLEVYEVLGLFGTSSVLRKMNELNSTHDQKCLGWYYGDFFIEDFPSNLEYTGIYRYLNNPEVISGAAFFGLACVGPPLP